MQIDLPDGFILDCACGSGIQLAAYAATLQRPVLGVELAPGAGASERRERSLRCVPHPRYERSMVPQKPRRVWRRHRPQGRFICAWGKTLCNVAFLHLDPARPLQQPNARLGGNAAAVAPCFGSVGAVFEEPALLLDLSPRLTESQRNEVEALDAVWPGIARTWEWTSEAGGALDRLALWLGKVADPSAARRFVRVPASLADRPVVLSIENDPPTIEPKHRSPQRGEHVSILDAALMESGLMLSWLASVAPDDDGRWAFVEGRRPQLHHDRPLRLNSSDGALVQATGKVVHC